MKKLIDKIRQNKRKLIIVISITLVLISLLGTSFALIYKEKVLDANNSYTTGNLQLLLNSGTVLTLNNAFPMDDSVGAGTIPYTFTVENTGSVIYKYTLKLVSTTTDNVINSDYIKIKIDDNEPVILSSINDVLYSNLYLESGKSQTFNIRIWLDENTPNSEIGMSYSAKVVLEGVSTNSLPGSDTLVMEYETSKEENALVVTTAGGESITQIPELDLMEDSFGNLRYYGDSPDNYVTFNGEKAGWRIIGIFNVENDKGKVEKRIKLIRSSSIGNHPYDNKTNGIGSSSSDNGSNNWSDSRLMIMLNPEEETFALRESDAAIYPYLPGLFWSSGSGSCYSKTSGCDFTSIGLTSVAYDMIGKVKYGVSGYSASTGLYADDWYKYETTSSGLVWDDNDREWVGSVGLVSASDYAYASDLSICKQPGINYHTDTTNCTGTNWIYKLKQSGYMWTMTPNSHTATRVFRVGSTGSVNYNDAAQSYAIIPVVFLLPTIEIVDGLGTSEDPYILG